MLRNCFLDFAVEHWFGCRATEPGFAWDIGAIEVWLIDWLMNVEDNKEWLTIFNFYRYSLKTCRGWQIDRWKLMGWWHEQAHSSPSPPCSGFLKEGDTLVDHSGQICGGFLCGQSCLTGQCPCWWQDQIDLVPCLTWNRHWRFPDGGHTHRGRD